MTGTAGRRPNVLLVMVDQLAAGWLPAHGHAVTRAPHLTALAREGVVVAIGDLDAGAAEAAAAELANGSLGLSLDVTDRPVFTAFLDEVEQRLGPIDILVNNAGIMHVTPLDEESDASITRQLEINLHAVIHGTQEAVKRMKPRRTGHIEIGRAHV